MRFLEGLELQTGVVQLKPVTFMGYRLVLSEQPHNDPQRLVHHLALAFRVNAKHVGV